MPAFPMATLRCNHKRRLEDGLELGDRQYCERCKGNEQIMSVKWVNNSGGYKNSPLYRNGRLKPYSGDASDAPF